jgi:hypothetical protein
MEDFFTVSRKARISARGFARFAVLGGAFFALLALLSLQSIGSGFFVFSLIALYFFGMFAWQWRLYRMLERAAVMLDDDGLLVSFNGQDVLYGGEELCLEQGCFPRALGLGKRVRVCRAFLVCGRELFVDVDSRSPPGAGLPVLKGRAIPLDANAYMQLLDSLERRGWGRPFPARAPEGAPDGLPRAQTAMSGGHPLRPLRIVYLGTGVLAFLAHALLEDPSFALIFLLLGLACTGLFLNTFYTRTRP